MVNGHYSDISVVIVVIGSCGRQRFCSCDIYCSWRFFVATLQFLMVLRNNATVRGGSLSLTTLVFVVVLCNNATVRGDSLSLTTLVFVVVLCL